MLGCFLQVEAGRHMPLPRPKPRTLEIAVKNHGKDNVDLANSDADRRAATRSGQAVNARLQRTPRRAGMALRQ